MLWSGIDVVLVFFSETVMSESDSDIVLTVLYHHAQQRSAVISSCSETGNTYEIAIDCAGKRGSRLRFVVGFQQGTKGSLPSLDILFVFGCNIVCDTIG